MVWMFPPAPVGSFTHTNTLLSSSHSSSPAPPAFSRTETRQAAAWPRPPLSNRRWAPPPPRTTRRSAQRHMRLEPSRRTRRRRGWGRGRRRARRGRRRRGRAWLFFLSSSLSELSARGRGACVSGWVGGAGSAGWGKRIGSRKEICEGLRGVDQSTPRRRSILLFYRFHACALSFYVRIVRAL